MADRPLCFVLMPFGTKRDPSTGREIDFDAVYAHGIRPAIEEAGMEALRADEERTGGIIHRAMFERLLLCDFAVADLTTANANVFYELGVRHATRPSTTLALFASHQMPPFDVNFLRALPYELDDRSAPAGPAEGLRGALAARLRDLRALAGEDAAVDSPLFQLLENYGAPDIARLATDTFRDRARYAADIRRELEAARRTGDPAAVEAVQARLGSLDGVEGGVLVDLLLSYRATEAWSHMVDLHEQLPAALRRSSLVRQQHAFALNRAGERDRAIAVLEELVAERGTSSETQGLLGRIYKDLWKDALAHGRGARAAGLLRLAIDAYVLGFESDPRDAYPGINALTLLEVQGEEESLQRKAELLPVVRFAVVRRIRTANPDYWDHATLLELAVLAGDPRAAIRHLGDAVACVREPWEARSTADNLDTIRAARETRGPVEGWIAEVVDELRAAQQGFGGGEASAIIT